MPPKGNAGKEKDIAEEDEVLQAVILADSFNKRFKPLTVGKPRVSRSGVLVQTKLTSSSVPDTSLQCASLGLDV